MGLALVAVDVFIAVGTSVSASRSRSSSFIVERLVSALVLGLARHTKPFPLGRKFILLLAAGLDLVETRRGSRNSKAAKQLARERARARARYLRVTRITKREGR